MHNICMKVPRVYDWLTKEIECQTCFCLMECCTITDQICSDFTLTSSSNLRRLWAVASGDIPRAGTISICFDRGSGDAVDVFVNGIFVFFVKRGEIRSTTVEFLHSLEVRCSEEERVCQGSYSLSIHHKIEEIYRPDSADDMECYLADSCGNKISATSPGAIECIEVVQIKEREDRQIITQTGDTVPLQKVIVRISGYMVVEFKRNGEVCKWLEPFECTESLLLCAPKGTRIECDIIAFDCVAIMEENNSCGCIKMIINVCQHVQSKADVVIALREEFCGPRLDF